MRILLLTPPMIHLNSPYPATPFLKAGISEKKHTVDQVDLSLEMALRIFSKKFLKESFGVAEKSKSFKKHKSFYVLKSRSLIEKNIQKILAQLQNKKTKYSTEILKGKLFPIREDRKKLFKEYSQVFEGLDSHEKARHLASLFLGDLSAMISHIYDPGFQLTRWNESLVSNQRHFENIEDVLNRPKNRLEKELDSLVEEEILKKKYDLVGMSAPFPGNLFGAFRIAQYLKEKQPSINTVLGGGYVNTELRTLKSPEVFKYFDFVCLDDGQVPLELVIEAVQGEAQSPQLKRTFIKSTNGVVLRDDSAVHGRPFSKSPAPDYRGLDFSRYLCFFEVPNPMHRLWSDEKWNKLIVAHGCYWKKCTFCDLSLDYINRYEQSPAKKFVDDMEKLAEQNGIRQFHFVDEAAPPASLKAISEELIKRNLDFKWWGNIRFEKSFNDELCQLMADAGCIAVTGGLEVASNRLLKLINKGVSVEQVARVTKNFSDAGIMTHAYLMYGFPTQNLQEFVDSVEYVRQLFEQGCLHSAFWHRFAATAHSPVGMHPKDFSIKLLKEESFDFAKNEVFYSEKLGIDWDQFDAALGKATYNYMLGMGWEKDVRSWFKQRLPRSSVPPDFIFESLIGA